MTTTHSKTVEIGIGQMETHKELSEVLAAGQVALAQIAKKRCLISAPVTGDTMAPRYSVGDTAYFEKGRNVSPGDDVIFEMEIGKPELGVYIRRFMGRGDNGTLIFGTYDGQEPYGIPSEDILSIHLVVACGFGPDGMRKVGGILDPIPCPGIRDRL